MVEVGKERKEPREEMSKRKNSKFFALECQGEENTFDHLVQPVFITWYLTHSSS